MKTDIQLVVLSCLQERLDQNLKIMSEKYSDHQIALNDSFNQWKKDPCYDLSLGIYDDKDRYVDIVPATNCRRIQELQESIWECEHAFDEAKKYRELISTLKTVKSVFFSEDK